MYRQTPLSRTVARPIMVEDGTNMCFFLATCAINIIWCSYKVLRTKRYTLESLESPHF